MTTYVTATSTGRNGGRPTARGENRLSGQMFTASVASTNALTWTVTRWETLRFILRDAEGLDTATAGRAAAILVTLSANEAGWGGAEWNYNGFGMHCGGYAQCVRFPADTQDPELRAYSDLATALRDVVAFVKAQAGATDWGLILAGDLAGLVNLWRRGVFGAGSNTANDWNSILHRVRMNLGADGAALTLRDLDPSTDLRAGGSGGGAGGAGSGTRRRKGGLGTLLLAGLVLAGVMSSGKR